MSWGISFNHAEDHEDSFWPSFTDIMMVIVMTFLLVTVAVVLTNTRLLDELKSSLVAEEAATQRAEFTLRENATLEEQLDYFQQRTASLEMELLRSRAENENTRSQLGTIQAELRRLQVSEQARTRLLNDRDQQLSDLQSNLEMQNTLTERLQNELEQIEQQLVAGKEQQIEWQQVRDQISSDNERLQTELSQVQNDLTETTRRLQGDLETAQLALDTSQAVAQASESALTDLQEQTERERLKLADLKGEYAELNQKYQKLLKPTRSSKDKQVVDVMYRKAGYRIRRPGEANYRAISLAAMNAELAALKAKHGNDLYVKIVIPENSGLSYNQAWAFTRDTLNKYDYYYQSDVATSGTTEESEN